MADRRANRAERAARRDRRDAPQAQYGDVVDELLNDQGAAALPPPPLIPIVRTVESSLDLPPNWQTGELPQLQPGVAQNLPPLPPSLGSVSGRRSSPSGYTPPPPGPVVPQPVGRQGGGRSPAQGRSRGSQQSTAPSAGYVNEGSGEQRTGDLFEGPVQPTRHRLMGGLGHGVDPPIPARDLDLGTPARPGVPHPGRQAPRSFHELGARGYSAYGEYEVRRMIAYRHLNLPAPPINVPPTITDENRDRTYVVRLTAPNCQLCHEKQTVIAHRL